MLPPLPQQPVPHHTKTLQLLQRLRNSVPRFHSPLLPGPLSPPGGSSTTCRASDGGGNAREAGSHHVTPGGGSEGSGRGGQAGRVGGGAASGGDVAAEGGCGFEDSDEGAHSGVRTMARGLGGG
jgi:hypothetical protein